MPISPWADHWNLRPGVTYLNHGSFGPAPRTVRAAHTAWVNELHREPMDFFMRRLDPALRAARERLGRFVGTSGDNLCFVDNATMAMNVIAHNLPLAPGDEVLSNHHEYGAVYRLWQARCAAADARLVVARLPCPIESAQALVDALFAAVTPRTRAIVVSHVTSPTAMIFPVQEICRQARRQGIITCIDGPHAVAMLPLEIDALDCDYYAASCHKWLSAPFGCGFLYVHPRHQPVVRPLVTSWGRTPTGEPESWRDEFSWVGTRDPAAFLSVTAAIAWIEGIGLTRFRDYAHGLVTEARRQITAWTGLPALVPDGNAWYGTMISLPLPPGDCPGLQQALWDRFQIEVPIVDWEGYRLVRPSCHLYSTLEDIEILVWALKQLL